jgi:dipeptidyl aminopeptidase/acylaminoacyl peptidase
MYKPLLYKLAFVCAFAAIAAAQQRPLELKDYYQIESVSSPALSPDGRKVAYLRTHIIEAENKRRSEIWVAEADGSKSPARVSNPAVNATNPRWSSDSKLLSYSEGGSQWFVSADKPEPFHIPGVGGPAVFSPDGKWIAFVKKVAPPKADTPEHSEFDKLTQERFKGRMYDWMNFRFDGRGYLPDPRNPAATPPLELFVVPITGGEPKQLTHLGVDVKTPAWRADSGALTFTADLHQRDEYAYERADLWTVTPDSQPKRITQDDGWQHLSPAWSPDGKFIAVLREEGLRRVLNSKRTHGSPVDVYLFPADGQGAPRNLTANWDYIPGAPEWSEDGHSLYFHAGVKGNAHLFRLSIADGSVAQVTQGDRVLGEVSIAGDHFAYSAAASDHPAEIYLASTSGANEKKLTTVQDGLLGQWQLGKVERIRYDSKDGTSIDGWVVLPPGYNAHGASYPLVLTIHGGPHGADTSSFTFEEQLIAAAGYIVVYTNPRGSTGYGEKFLWGTWGAWGDRDFEDVMGGVDYAIKHYNADPKRLGVTGYSYGGFLTNWVIGHTTRFSAAVVGAGPSDWISNYGTGDIPRTKESEFLGAPWDPKANAVMIAHSPVTYATNIRTPTMFVHGEADERVPIAQGEEMYTTLKKRQVPAKFVRYPGEFHGGWSPWDTVHRYQQELLWWKQYLGQSPANVSSSAALHQK